MIFQYAVNIEEVVHFDRFASLMTEISDERKERIARYRFDLDKIRCLLAELLVRYILAKQFGVDPRSLTFQHSEFGKPSLVSGNIRFNLSHAGDWIVCAIGNSEIGVDVEAVKQMDFQTVYRVFAEREIARLDKASPEIRSDLFYQLWTLKESYVKFLGLGMQYPFSDFAIDLGNDGNASVIYSGATKSVSFLSTKLDEKHWYALCMNGEEQFAPIQKLPMRVLCGYFLNIRTKTE